MYNARWPKTYRHSGLILRKVSPGCIECKEQVLDVLFLETMVYFRKIIHSTMKVGMSNFYHFQLDAWTSPGGPNLENLTWERLG